MPKLQNILINPVVHVLLDEPTANGYRETVLAVDGLVCRLCAARVRQALRDVPGVTNVEFDHRDDRFRVNYRSTRPLSRSLAEAAQSMVIAPRVRRLLGSSRKGGRLFIPGRS